MTYKCIVKCFKILFKILQNVCGKELAQYVGLLPVIFNCLKSRNLRYGRPPSGTPPSGILLEGPPFVDPLRGSITKQKINNLQGWSEIV